MYGEVKEYFYYCSIKGHTREVFEGLKYENRAKFLYERKTIKFEFFIISQLNSRRTKSE